MNMGLTAFADEKHGEGGSPHIFVEPPIPTACEINTVDHVRSIIYQHDRGNFRQSALLVERMLWNPRLRAVVETRLAGLIATAIRWRPAKNNRDGRRAAQEFAEDWPLIAPAPMRKQLLKWALFLGFGLGQRPLDESPTTGRQVFKLRPYWPGFAMWYWSENAYRIQTFDRGVTAAATPSNDRDARAVSPLLETPPPADRSPWVIAEPFGTTSYRDGLLHAAWRPWLGHEWAARDQARGSEKNGVGIIKAYYPRGSGAEHKEALGKFLRGLRNMGSEGQIPCERRPDDPEGANGFDAEPFEFTGAGAQSISDTLGANAVALAILFLGHNLTTEIKGGGSYAAAGVADYIRDDKKLDDAEAEWAYVGPQLAAPWAAANYGDPGLAPIAEYVTDSPAVNLQRAQMIQALGLAAAQLRANVPRVDLEALAEEFRLPILVEDKTTVQVPAPVPVLVPPAAPEPAKEPTP